MLIIGGINLYRAFALYKVEKSFNVLNGVVPDFKKVYTEEILHGADPVLDQEGELVPVKIDDAGNVTKANVKEKWYEYGNKEWANAVILTSTGKSKNYKEGATIAESDIESYFVWIPKYQYKIWNLGKYTSISSVNTSQVHAIEIEFGLTNTKDDESNTNHKECATPMLSNKVQGASEVSGNCGVGEWMTHPAFLAFNTNGLWVGKFETGYKQTDDLSNITSWSKTGAEKNTNTESSKVIIKPNVYSWRNIALGNAYQTSFAYQRDLDSHMMKNTEWGAVAYLQHSVYGSKQSVRFNNNSNMVTGYASKSEPTCGYYSGSKNAACHQYEGVVPKTNGSYGYNYADKNSVVASTTGNYSGIYGMSGGTIEFVMGVMMNSGNQTVNYGQSGLTSTILNDTKYYDVYNYHNSTDYTYYTTRILGDATGEMGPFGKKHYDPNTTNTLLSRYISSWYEDEAYYICASAPWFTRGNGYAEGVGTGLFSFGGRVGTNETSFGFRIVLAI